MGNRRQYFGQHGDDYLLWQLFGAQADGFFVDVGAFDGVHLSNSYSFELAGWNGICVEAIPDLFDRCQKARPGTICVHAACVGDSDLSEVKFFVEKLGLLSGLSAGESEDEIRRRYTGRGIEFEGFQELTVPARTLNSILAEHLPPGRGVDFLSIDVEGTELDVLRGFDLARYAPRCVVVEANDSDQQSAILDYLVTGANYILARQLGCNLFFAGNENDAATLRKTTIDCRIEPTVHPLGEAYTLRDHLHGKVIKPNGGRMLRVLKQVLRRGNRS